MTTREGYNNEEFEYIFQDIMNLQLLLRTEIAQELRNMNL